MTPETTAFEYVEDVFEFLLKKKVKNKKSVIPEVGEQFFFFGQLEKGMSMCG